MVDRPNPSERLGLGRGRGLRRKSLHTNSLSHAKAWLFLLTLYGFSGTIDVSPYRAITYNHNLIISPIIRACDGGTYMSYLYYASQAFLAIVSHFGLVSIFCLTLNREYVTMGEEREVHNDAVCG